jgi:hypothetical protein
MIVLAIPESFRKDQFILDPILRAMLKWRGMGSARLEICRDPLLGGVEQALRLENIKFIVENHPMIDLFLLCVDRDGDPHRRRLLDALEHDIKPFLKSHQRFLGEHAWQELEVWTLAGLDLPNDWRWSEIRAERDPKEAYFLKLARARGLDYEDDNGRKRLSLEASRRYKRIRRLCREDIVSLETRL